MATDLPPIPPAVVKYAEQHKHEKVVFNIDWNGYKVYLVGPFAPDDGKV